MQGVAGVGVCVLGCSVTSNSLLPHGFCPWDFPGKNTRVRCVVPGQLWDRLGAGTCLASKPGLFSKASVLHLPRNAG